MLRFRLHQVHVPSLGRYFLPLPKLADSQLVGLSSHLEARGFSVRRGSKKGKMIAPPRSPTFWALRDRRPGR
jgi:hypothetical protein